MSNPSSKLAGASLAMAVAGLVGCASTGGESATSSSVLSAAGKTDMVHCSGVNTCKGHNDCRTAANACAGKGSCKGTGFVAMPSKACGDVGGKRQDDWRGEISTANLVHCNEVNVCKGHNDCASAANSCKGQGSCKGAGFVAMPAEACSDIGGDVQG